MSIISKDKEVVRKPRKAVGGKAALRDRIVKKLYKRLTDDELLQKLSNAWRLGVNNQAEAIERQQVFLADIDGRAAADSEQPFSQTSNLHLPVPFIITKTYHARFMQALLGVDPPFSLKARQESATDSIQMLEDLMRYTLGDWANKNRGVEDTIDTWLWNWCSTGTGIVKARWLTEYERIIDVEPVQQPIAPRVEIDPETGTEFLVPQFEMVEKEVTKDLRCFYGPMLEYVNLEDFCMVGGNGDPDSADIVFHRTFKTSSELYNLVDRGIFDADAVHQVIEGGRDYKAGSIQSDIKEQRASNSGLGSIETEANQDRYEVIEALLKYDVEESGITSDIVVWFSEKHALLGCTYLRRIIKSGKRPYSVIHFHKRPDQAYGIGLPEILHPLTKELDALHNIRIDTGLLTNMPFFFYRSGAVDAENIQLEPGTGYPVENPQTDVFFPTIANKTAFTAQEEQVIQSYIERLTGISDLSLGIMSGSQGATRTASGVRALLGESNSNLDVHLRRLNRGWKRVLHLIYELIQTRIEPEFTFRVTGQDGKDVFYNLQGGMLPEVDFELSANSSNSNKSVQIEVAQQLMGLTMNPLNIQLGICGPGEIYESQKNYVQSLGVKDINRFFKKPEGHMYVMEPKDEFLRVIKGMDVPVPPQGDHAGFIAFAQTMIDQQSEAQYLDEGQIQAVIAQIRKHEQMQAALDHQQSQVAVQSQMQQNAVQSQSQSPAALNPMAGASPGALPVQ